MPQQGYINVKLLPERTHETHRLIQQNVEKLYGPVEVYRQYLGEFCVEPLSLEDIYRDNLSDYHVVFSSCTDIYSWNLCEIRIVPSFVKTFTDCTLGSFVWYLSYVGKLGELYAVYFFAGQLSVLHYAAFIHNIKLIEL